MGGRMGGMMGVGRRPRERRDEEEERPPGRRTGAGRVEMGWLMAST